MKAGRVWTLCERTLSLYIYVYRERLFKLTVGQLLKRNCSANPRSVFENLYSGICLEYVGGIFSYTMARIVRSWGMVIKPCAVQLLHGKLSDGREGFWWKNCDFGSILRRCTYVD